MRRWSVVLDPFCGLWHTLASCGQKLDGGGEWIGY